MYNKHCPIISNSLRHFPILIRSRNVGQRSKNIGQDQRKSDKIKGGWTRLKGIYCTKMLHIHALCILRVVYM